jgi:hypothetical protein
MDPLLSTLLGLACEEATFFTRLLKRLGIRSLLQTILAGTQPIRESLCSIRAESAQEGGKVQAVLLKDCAAFDTVHPVPYNRPLDHYLSQITPLPQSGYVPPGMI